MSGESRRESLIGRSLPRIGSLDKALGRAKYAGDMVLPGMLYGKILRSPHAHAKILNIDTTKAEKIPGVKVVVTGIQDTPRNCFFGVTAQTRDQILLPYDKVRYVGEEVAAVAAIDEDAAEEALEEIKVEYEPLPHVLTWQEAMKEGAPLVHENRPQNIASRYLIHEGNVEDVLKKSDFVWEGRLSCDVASHALSEPFCAVVSFESSGKFNIWNQTQCPFQLRQALHNCLNVPLTDIRIHSLPMGGTHGGRSDSSPATFIACLLSQKAGRPVQIKLNREEVEDCMRDKASKLWDIRVGFKRDGQITAKDISMMLEAGAYASSAIVELWVPLLVDEVLWRSPNYRYDAYLIYTNKTIGSMMRTRSHIAPMSMEICFDETSKELGIDPIELRLINATKPDDITPTRSVVTSCGLRESIAMAVEKSGWKEKRGKLGYGKGIGIGSGNTQSMFFMGFRSGSTAFIKFNDDGSCTVFTGNGDLGQGTQTAHVQVASEVTGIPMSMIKVCYGDTELCYQDPGNYSMSGTIISANAVRKAAKDAKRRLLEVAADLLDVSWAEVEMGDDLRFFVKRRIGKGKTVSLTDVCRTAFRRGKPIYGFGDYRARVDYSDFDVGAKLPYQDRVYGQKVSAYSFGTTTAEVEVDTETGVIKVKKIVAVNDCGTVLNPMLVRGNMHGQLNFMLGQAFYEKNIWDEKTGRKRTSSFRTYKVPTANEAPEIETYFLNIPDPDGPFGAKEGSLGFGAGLHGAISNAIHDAVGVRVLDVPITPESMLKLLKEKEAKERHG